MPNHSVLKRVVLGPQHRVTGKTRHYYGTAPLPPPSELRIAPFAGDPGFYLLYLDSSGNELTDTYHGSVEEAMAQADFEFEVNPSDWRDGADQ